MKTILKSCVVVLTMLSMTTIVMAQGGPGRGPGGGQEGSDVTKARTPTATAIESFGVRFVRAVATAEEMECE